MRTVVGPITFSCFKTARGGSGAWAPLKPSVASVRLLRGYSSPRPEAIVKSCISGDSHLTFARLSFFLESSSKNFFETSSSCVSGADGTKSSPGSDDFLIARNSRCSRRRSHSPLAHRRAGRSD